MNKENHFIYTHHAFTLRNSPIKFCAASMLLRAERKLVQLSMCVLSIVSPKSKKILFIFI